MRGGCRRSHMQSVTRHPLLCLALQTGRVSLWLLLGLVQAVPPTWATVAAAVAAAAARSSAPETGTAGTATPTILPRAPSASAATPASDHGTALRSRSWQRAVGLLVRETKCLRLAHWTSSRTELATNFVCAQQHSYGLIIGRCCVITF